VAHRFVRSPNEPPVSVGFEGRLVLRGAAFVPIVEAADLWNRDDGAIGR